MNKTFLIRLTILALVVGSSGCGWIQSLRKDVEDDDVPSSRGVDRQFNYNDPANRSLPPPPATVTDQAEASISGTAVDLSGTRARSGRVTKQDFINESMKNENSLWNEDGQNNYLFARNKLKAPGDLVTVVIEDHLRHDMVNEVKKVLPPEYQDQDIVVPGLTKETPQTAAADAPPGAAAGRGPAGAAAAPGAPPAPTAATAGGLAPEDILTAEVLERYPNGNVRIRGVKRVPFKRSVRNIEVIAILKGADIGENDQVPSSKFFEQHVEIYR